MHSSSTGSVTVKPQIQCCHENPERSPFFKIPEDVPPLQEDKIRSGRREIQLSLDASRPLLYGLHRGSHRVPTSTTHLH